MTRTDNVFTALNGSLDLYATNHGNLPVIRLTVRATDAVTMAFLTHQEARRLAYGILARADPYQQDKGA